VKRRLSRQAVEVLAVFARDPSRPRYGLELADEVGLHAGSVYVVLANLEKRGLLASENEPQESAKQRPPRRYYTLTDEGRQVAEDELSELRKLGGEQ
jgi:DNA-binding PadR family transcriptional regulator